MELNNCSHGDFNHQNIRVSKLNCKCEHVNRMLDNAIRYSYKLSHLKEFKPLPEYRS